jgi:lipopolysaccharide biosynthesis glycosyltransferase
MRLNIVFASDQIYIEHLAVAIYSLFKCNPTVNFNVYIFNTDIDGASWSRLSELAAQYGQNLFDIKIVDREIEGLVLNQSVTKATYYRLFIPEKLGFDKVLYLDSDIVVNGSIEDLYNTNIDQCYVAAVADAVPNPHEDLGMSEGSKYFNCGVMLLNLPKWREDRIKERVIDLIRNKPWVIRFPDQCGINSIVDGRWKELHPKYNAQTIFFQVKFEHTRSDLYPAGQLREGIDNPVIIHYTGKQKPWHLGYKHRFRKLYWRNLRETPFNSNSRAELRLVNFLILCVRKLNKEVKKRMPHQP